MRRSTIAVSVLAVFVAALFTVSAWAQEPADTLKVDYFSNANTTGAPDGTLRITYPGTVAVPTGTKGVTGVPNVCAYIAVFDSNQEMTECCGCLQTPDGLATLSVDTDLTSNPLTGKKLQTGAVKILSVQPVNNTCPLPGQGQTGVVTPAVRAWMTHIQNSNFAITETASQDATLSLTEANRLGQECASIVIVGSGSGVCTCGTGE